MLKTDKSPLELNDRLSQKFKCRVYLKREDMLVTKSSAIRAVINKLSFIIANENQGVKFVTCSNGNFAYSFAFYCNYLKIRHKIYVPKFTSHDVKKKICALGKEYLTLCEEGNSFIECLNIAQFAAFETNMFFVHPYNDNLIIDGYKSIGNEILNEIKPDIILIPILGGGLAAGIVKSIQDKCEQDKCEVYGVEYNTHPCMEQAIKNDQLIKLTGQNQNRNLNDEIGQIPFEICKTGLKKVILVDENEVCFNVEELHNDGIVSEMTGALSVTGISHLRDKLVGKNVVCIISNGNISISNYTIIKKKSLQWLGLTHYFVVYFPQKPNMLRLFVNDILNENDDIIQFKYLKKSDDNFEWVLIGIQLGNLGHLEKIKSRMKQKNFDYEQIKPDNIHLYLI